MRFVDFQALALEPKVLKLEGSSFGHRPSIYGIKDSNDDTLPPPIKKYPEQ